MNRFARTCLTLVLLSLPTIAQAQDAGTEEKTPGKPFYGYAGWGILTFGALWGACKASRR
jgi:hypothetical protein